MKKLLLLSLSLSGCASVFRGTSQEVMIETDPPGATCFLRGSPPVTSPAKIKINRGQRPTVLCVRKKEPPMVGNWKAKGTLWEDRLDWGRWNGYLWGDVIAGGFIGLGLDLIAGGPKVYEDMKLTKWEDFTDGTSEKY